MLAPNRSLPFSTGRNFFTTLEWRLFTLQILVVLVLTPLLLFGAGLGMYTVLSVQRMNCIGQFVPEFPYVPGRLWRLNALSKAQTGYPLFSLSLGRASARQVYSPWEHCAIVQSGLPSVYWKGAVQPPVVACSTLSPSVADVVFSRLRKAPRNEMLEHLESPRELPFWP
jgi:hypothetical protein